MLKYRRDFARQHRTDLSEKNNISFSGLLKKHSHIEETDHDWSQREQNKLPVKHRNKSLCRAASWLAAVKSEECVLWPISENEFVKYANIVYS